MHGLGFAAGCAPHHLDGGHVSDENSDLMYAGDAPWDVSHLRLDVNRDDYFNHGNPNCLDLAQSAFLDPLPNNAQIPPGW